MANREIASRIGISERTVKIHRAQSMEKPNAASLEDLVRFAEKLKSLISER